MAAGRRGSFRDQDLREKESDFEPPREKEFCQERDPRRSVREPRDRTRDRNNYRVRSRESKESRDCEAVNTSRRSLSSTSNSSGDKTDGMRRVLGSRNSVDREPGELSSGSDDDSHKSHRSESCDGEDQKLPNGIETHQAVKKRKFSPIVWDRDDSKRQNTPPPGRKTGLLADVRLPPPPPLPEGFMPTKTTESAVLLGRLSPLEPDVGTSKDEDRKNGDQQMDHLDGEDEEFALPRNISSSRWADENDDSEGNDEGGGEEIGNAKKKATPKETLMGGQKFNKRVTTPELGEVITRDRSGETASRLPDSGSDDEGLYHEFEVNEKDYVDVDSEHGDRDMDDQELDVDGEDEDAIVKVPDPLQPQQRSINMLQGCRSVDEFERLNKIDEGTYGVVYRAKNKKTAEIVALKKVKMEKEREGFPMTSLREINILLSFHHPSIVDVKEVVVGSSLDSIFMVMEYMEHDLKGLMESMKQPFSQSEVKCLMLQLLEGVKYLHDNWVLHRDLKTSNLLFNNRGELKICDFGLSRQYGSPLKPYTHLVVTLWYRAPELLLGMKEYSTAIDMWSLGCIMAELLAKEPLFNGRTEVDQLDKIFCILGTPNEKIWPGFSKLPGVKVNFVKHPYNRLREKFPPTSFSGRPTLSERGFDLLNKLLTYDPEKRITAEAALKHEWFKEVPLPKSKDFMPTFPAQHAHDRRLRRVLKSPDPLEEQRRKELQQGEIGTGSLFG